MSNATIILQNCFMIEFLTLTICSFIAKSGLSEGELEDILACDDDVLNDVYTYWTPPLRRLPPLLLLRLKADLNEYIGKPVNLLVFKYKNQLP